MSSRLGVLVIVTAVSAAGCSDPEIDRPGTWKPAGVNDHNLRAMLVNQQDTYSGTGALTSRGDSGSRAVTRLLVDKRRPLLDVSLSTVAPSTGAASDSGAVATPGSGSSGSSP